MADDTPVTRSDNTHKCPGGCRRDVANYKFACLTCWRRLPVELGRPISASWRVDPVAHAVAMTAAREWYRMHREAVA
jgi:hypothetical protein